MLTSEIFGFYDRDGLPLTIEEYEMILKCFRHTYKEPIGRNEIAGLLVATDWLGLDHSYVPGPHEPLIFETMIFRVRDGVVDYSADEERCADLHPELRDLIGSTWRYSTEYEARAAHDMICVEIRVIAAKIDMARDVLNEALNRKKQT